MMTIIINNLDRAKTTFVGKKYKMIINKIMYSTFIVLYIIHNNNKIAEFVCDTSLIYQIKNLNKFIHKYKFKIK